MMIVNFIKVSVCCMLLLVLGGCVSSKQIYCHDTSYTEAMYLYLQEDIDFQNQLELMDSYFESAEDEGTKVAPGAYAHYAMLKYKLGDEGGFLKYLDMEKSAFPDSVHYIDFVLSSAKNTTDKKSKTTESSNQISQNHNALDVTETLNISNNSQINTNTNTNTNVSINSSASVPVESELKNSKTNNTVEDK